MVSKGGARAPAATPAAKLREERKLRDRKLMGPYAEVILRASSWRRQDKLDFSVEVRPIGTKTEHLVARFAAQGDARQYGTVLARRSKCDLRNYV